MGNHGATYGQICPSICRLPGGPCLLIPHLLQELQASPYSVLGGWEGPPLLPQTILNLAYSAPRPDPSSILQHYRAFSLGPGTSLLPVCLTAHLVVVCWGKVARWPDSDSLASAG